MKIQIASDLHLEFAPFTLPNGGADVLVLAGDICIAEDLYRHPAGNVEFSITATRAAKAASYREFFARVSKEFDQVIYVAGNHEFYHGKWLQTHKILQEEMSRYENIAYLNNELCVYKGVTFVGATLWTNLNKGDPVTEQTLAYSMNEYITVKDESKGFSRLYPRTTYNAHKRSVKFINAAASDADAKYVVVTHHAPCFKSVHPNYVKERVMNGGYASDLSETILDRPQIKLWAHGHMHDASDYELGSTRIVCNPRGYPQEHPEGTFDTAKIVEI